MSVTALDDRFERARVDTRLALLAGASRPVRESLGITVAEVAGASVLCAREDPTGTLSSAAGLGLAGPVTCCTVDDVCAFFRGQGSRGFSLELRPEVMPDTWPEIAASRCLFQGESFLRLARETGPVTRGPVALPGLRIGTVPAEDAGEWAGVLLTAFGMLPDAGLLRLLASAVAAGALAGPSGRVRAVAARDGGTMVGVGVVCLLGDVAYLGNGATLPAYRRRGVQTALLDVRARIAAEAGCRWLLTEVAAPAPGEYSPSLRNVLRAGFVPRTTRTTWRWLPPLTPPAGRVRVRGADVTVPVPGS